MANTFKVVTKAGITTQDTIYTAGTGVTTVLVGVMLGNTTSSQVLATVTLSSDTANRAGANDEDNQDVELITNAPIPAGSSLELLSGNKVVLETTDEIKLTADGATDITLSIMEIT
jgi:ligand-binding sensor protein